MIYWDVFFSLIVSIVALPVLFFALEIFMSLMSQQRDMSFKEIDVTRPDIAVLVPAHNEESVIAEALIQIHKQLNETDRLLVVADNCDDKTVEIAEKSGAIVLERMDAVNQGKGFALEYGVQYLSKEPPDVVVVIDADCIVEEGVIDRIARLSVSECRPVQALYLMQYSGDTPSLKQRVASFAWLVKNYVRPIGLKHMGLPCQLMGTGMAFPFNQFKNVRLGSSNIVEDMQLGIDLTAQGHPPLFCPNVKVTSFFPEATQAEEKQRRRWEHGHIGMIVDQLPSLLIQSVVNRDLMLFTLSLDMLIPPLTLLAFLVLLLFATAGLVAILIEATTAFYLSVFILFLFLTAVFTAWVRNGREILSFRDMMSLPILILTKAPLYFQFVLNRQKKWERTERD